MNPEDLAERLGQRFGEVLLARGEVSVIVAPADLLQALQYLRAEEDLSFGFLSDLTVTDWPGLDPRFWVAYHLLSLERNHRVRVKAGLPGDAPSIDSVTGLYPTANWHEREVYDFFGIVFPGHPDLRRIEMPEGWVGHPLRKDHPLAGVPTAYKGAFVPPPDERGT